MEMMFVPPGTSPCLIQISNEHPDERFPFVAVKLSWVLSPGLCWVWFFFWEERVAFTLPGAQE